MTANAIDPDTRISRMERSKPPQPHIFFCVTAVLLATVAVLGSAVNHAHAPGARERLRKEAFLERVVLASPATVTAGRNIAFETSNALSNAPASYLTMLDCCESDEAIADRIATSGLRAAVRRGHGKEAVP